MRNLHSNAKAVLFNLFWMDQSLQESHKESNNCACLHHRSALASILGCFSWRAGEKLLPSLLSCERDTKSYCKQIFSPWNYFRLVFQCSDVGRFVLLPVVSVIPEAAGNTFFSTSPTQTADKFTWKKKFILWPGPHLNTSCWSVRNFLCQLRCAAIDKFVFFVSAARGCGCEACLGKWKQKIVFS